MCRYHTRQIQHQLIPRLWHPSSWLSQPSFYQPFKDETKYPEIQKQNLFLAYLHTLTASLQYLEMPFWHRWQSAFQSQERFPGLWHHLLTWNKSAGTPTARKAPLIKEIHPDFFLQCEYFYFFISESALNYILEKYFLSFSLLLTFIRVQWYNVIGSFQPVR